MRSTTLIVPGLHGSGPTHWQSWLEAQLPEARRVRQADWDSPVLDVWAQSVRDEIDRARGPVTLIAHSFGCLAAVCAAVTRRDRVAAALLVAPADPERFTRHGLRGETHDPAVPGLSDRLPAGLLGFPSLLVASTDDPWLRLTRAAWLAQRWGSRFLCLGAVGHINVDSGFGPWPQGLALLDALRSRAAGEFTGSLDAPAKPRRHAIPALLRKFA